VSYPIVKIKVTPGCIWDEKTVYTNDKKTVKGEVYNQLWNSSKCSLTIYTTYSHYYEADNHKKEGELSEKEKQLVQINTTLSALMEKSEHKKGENYYISKEINDKKKMIQKLSYVYFNLEELLSFINE